MTELLKIISILFDLFHEFLAEMVAVIGFDLTDKQLHFWIIGMIGIIIFMVVDVIFKALAKWRVSSISFIYTFTVLVVIVFSIEIQQKITGNGNMEFGDITAGLWGFIWIFTAYLLLKALIYLIKKLVKAISNK